MANSKVPNIIFSDNKTTIGNLETHQNFLDFHVENQYCIRNPQNFAKYKRANFKLYLVDNGSDIPLCRYAILIIKKGTGEKYYWGMDDIRMDNIGMREYESTLSPEGLAFIKKICRDLQNEEFHYKGKRPPKTKVIKLLESDLYDIIEDAIIQVLY